MHFDGNLPHCTEPFDEEPGSRFVAMLFTLGPKDRYAEAAPLTWELLSAVGFPLPASDGPRPSQQVRILAEQAARGKRVEDQPGRHLEIGASSVRMALYRAISRSSIKALRLS